MITIIYSMYIYKYTLIFMKKFLYIYVNAHRLFLVAMFKISLLVLFSFIIFDDSILHFFTTYGSVQFSLQIHC